MKVIILTESNLPAQPDDKDIVLQQDMHQYEIAKLSIDANIRNQNEVRALMWANTKAGVLVVLSIIATIFVFFMYALSLGKDAFLSDIIKVMFGAFGGGGLGYAIGIKKNR